MIATKGWAKPEVRNQIVDYVRIWTGKTGIKASKMIKDIGITPSKFYSWQTRYGRANEHNSSQPNKFSLTESEKQAIIDYYRKHPLERYRRLTYMMLDEDVVAVSCSSVYRVLSKHGFLRKWNNSPSDKGQGFKQPLKPHQHWHIDICYINICGTSYYMCSILDGYSRYIVHWELHESMKEQQVEIILQRALEKFPNANPRIISDNGSQFISKDFKEYVRVQSITHVRTSPYYPQSNGKVERYQKTFKVDCIRPKTPLSLDDGRSLGKGFVEHYNNNRLHSAIGYIAPFDKLIGNEHRIMEQRNNKLAAARIARKLGGVVLTDKNSKPIILSVGETETGSAGVQPVRDSRTVAIESPWDGGTSSAIPLKKCYLEPLYT